MTTHCKKPWCKDYTGEGNRCKYYADDVVCGCGSEKPIRFAPISFDKIFDKELTDIIEFPPERKPDPIIPEGKHAVYIQSVLAMKKRMKEINFYHLQDIVLIDKNGDVVEVDKKLIDEWKFTGLSNIEFIADQFYKEEE